MTWCLRFSEATFADWKDKFTICLWEGKNKMSYLKAKAEEQRYIQEAYEDVQMAEPDSDSEVADEEDADDENNDQEDDEPVQSNADEEDESTDSDDNFAKGSKNAQLAVGYKNDLSFVTRGNMIGVFAQKDDKIRFRTAIDRVKDLDGKAFNPQKVNYLSAPSADCRRLCFTTRIAICSYWIRRINIQYIAWISSMARSSMSGKCPTVWKLITSFQSM